MPFINTVYVIKVVKVTKTNVLIELDTEQSEVKHINNTGYK